jgi:ubiquinone/menaquinone biosynthesis methyltransferase
MLARLARRTINNLKSASTIPPAATPETPSQPTEQKTIDFGEKQVPIEKKQILVNEVFSSVADSYDLMNDFMSAGIHRLWKDDFVNDMGSFYVNQPMKFLDVAGGTGDIAFRIAEKLKKDIPSFMTHYPKSEVTVMDINPNMLAVGRDRAQKLGYQLNWVEGNAEELPFGDNEFDFYTIAFGIRNVPNRDKALREAWRVLKPGGRFMCLEFSKVNNSLVSSFYDMYSDILIPRLGSMIAGDSESYRYLVESIRKFPSQEEFAFMIHKAGFKFVTHRDLTFGICAIHSGVKILE